MPFVSWQQYFWLKANRPKQWREWVEKYGKPPGKPPASIRRNARRARRRRAVKAAARAGGT